MTAKFRVCETVIRVVTGVSVVACVGSALFSWYLVQNNLYTIANLRKERDSLEEKIAFLETYHPTELNIEKITRGVRNRNPLNIVAMSTNNPWRGQVGKDSENHAVFETFEHGIRAGYLTLRNYYERRGINTLIGITSRFCEGDAEAYAKFIAKNIGVAYNEPLNVLDHMPGILRSMVKFENGFDIFPESYYVPYYNR